MDARAKRGRHLVRRLVGLTQRGGSIKEGNVGHAAIRVLGSGGNGNDCRRGKGGAIGWRSDRDRRRLIGTWLHGHARLHVWVGRAVVWVIPGGGKREGKLAVKGQAPRIPNRRIAGSAVKGSVHFCPAHAIPGIDGKR